MNPNLHCKRLGIRVLSWVYIVGATLLLALCGALSGAAGHAPLTMLEAIGSWYSVFLVVVHLVDSFLFGGWLWENTIGSGGGIGHVVGNAAVPIGFIILYPLFREFASKRLGSRERFTILYLVGSVLAVFVSAIYVDKGFNNLPLVFILGGIGIVLGAIFVYVDNTLMRVLGDKEK
jgi:hypothetical protein